MRYVGMFFISFAIFLAIDMVWLNIIAKKLYRRELGYLMADQFNVTAAFVFYALFVVGLIYFSIYPAFVLQSPIRALLLGAFFGLVTYATYDLTNLATVKDWPVLITMIDLAWGTTLGGLTSLFSYILYNRFF